MNNLTRPISDDESTSLETQTWRYLSVDRVNWGGLSAISGALMVGPSSPTPAQQGATLAVRPHHVSVTWLLSAKLVRLL